MAHRCLVLSCSSNSDEKTSDVVTFFEFPSTPKRKQIWLDRIGRPQFRTVRSTRLCSKHFDEKYFARNGHEITLENNAVPFSLNKTKRSTRPPISNSSRSEDVDILLNGNKRGQDTSITQDPPIRAKRLCHADGSNDFGNGAVANSNTQQTKAIESTKPTPPISKNQASTTKAYFAKPTRPTARSNENNNKLVRKTNASEVSQVSGIRPRRNTVFVGSYNCGSRSRVTAAHSQNQSLAEQPSVDKSATVTARQRKAITKPNLFHSESDALNALENRLLFRGSKTTFSSLSGKQSSIVEHSSIGSDHVRQVNAAVTRQDGPGTRPAIASYNRRPRTALSSNNPITTNQPSIATFFGRNGTSFNQQADVETRKSKKEDCTFGWTLMGSHAVPFIVQDSEYFCSIRMLEKSALAKYDKLRPKIGRCCDILECFPVTQVQCDLLNEINFEHCDKIFGKEMFSLKEKLVRLRDADKYYTFVDLCHQPFMKGVRVESEGLEFGFTLVNKKSFIPYLILNGRKLIPMKYLHCDETILYILKGKFQILSDDDALYLKFCCKFDGMEDANDIEVIELREIVNLAPPQTKFKDRWPSDDIINEPLRLVMTTKGISFETMKVNGRGK